MLASLQHGGDASDDLFPGLTRFGEAFLAWSCQPIDNAAAAADRLAAAGQIVLSFEPVQDGINTAFAELELLTGCCLDGFDQVVAMHGALAEQLEDQQLGDAVQEVRVCLRVCLLRYRHE